MSFKVETSKGVWPWYKFFHVSIQGRGVDDGEDKVRQVITQIEQDK